MKKLLYISMLSSVFSLLPAALLAAPTAYIPNHVDETVSVIDVASGSTTTTIDVLDNPTGIATTADNGTLYLTNENGGAISVIDTASNTVSQTISVPTGRPEGIDLSPDESTLVVADSIFDRLHIVDTASANVTNSVTVAAPGSVRFSADGAKLYATLANAGDIEVYDTGTWNLLTTISPVGTNPGPLLLDESSGTLYVATQTSLEIIDTATDSVTDSVDLSVFGHSSSGLALDPGDERLYVGNGDTGEVKVIDTAAASVITTFAGLGAPRGLALTASTDFLYVIDHDGDQVNVVDTASGSIASTIAVGEEPVAEGDFIIDAPMGQLEARQVPTLGPVGLLGTMLVLLVAGGWMLQRRQRSRF